MPHPAENRFAAWSPLLQHIFPCPGEGNESEYCSGQQLCRLLQTSKSTQQTIATQCKGRLAVSVALSSLQQARSFAKWLSKPMYASNGHMLRTLRCDLEMPDPESASEAAHILAAAILSANQAAAAAISAGGQAASASSSSSATTATTTASTATAATGMQSRLLLTDFITSTPDPVILQSLASVGCQLTSLSMDFQGKGFQWDRSSMQQLAKTLGSLTALKKLELCGAESIVDEDSCFMGLNELVQYLSQLTNLVSLELHEVDDQHSFPEQLQELTYHAISKDLWEDVYSTAYDAEGFFQLGHLIALTRLECHGATEYHPEWGSYPRTVLYEHDILPPNLLELHIPDCKSHQPILQCQKLALLDLDDCRLSAEALQQLGNVKSLQEVWLSFPTDGQEPGDGGEDEYYAADAAIGWAALPLKRLQFDLDLTAIKGWDPDSNEQPSPVMPLLDEDERASYNRNVTLLQQLGLQTGLTSLQISLVVDKKDVARQLGLLDIPVRHLVNLREIHISVEGASPTSASKDAYSEKPGFNDLMHSLSNMPGLQVVELSNIPQSVGLSAKSILKRAPARVGKPQLKLIL